MANVKLKWKLLKFSATDNVTAWKDLMRLAKIKGDDELQKFLRSKRAVYVIRVCRPFSFAYEKDFSPVAYIGKGGSQTRLRIHLGTWMIELTEKIPSLTLEIKLCVPRLRRLGYICEDVEANLIKRFEAKLGELPLNNRNRPSAVREHIYDSDSLSVLYCGKGRGFHWGIQPMRSSPFYKE